MKETIIIIILLVLSFTYMNYVNNKQAESIKAYQERQALCESKEYRSSNAHCNTISEQLDNGYLQVR